MDSKSAPSKGSLISAMFLVGGTCIGGGMLALPVATGISGFFPSIITMAICWLMMTASALLLLEASLWMEEGAHMITISSKLLGLPGKALSWLLFLFISYCSLVAYTAGGGLQLIHALNAFLGLELTKPQGCLLFILLFGVIIDLGTRVVGRVNAILFVAMIIAYLCLVVIGIDEVKPELLLKNLNWTYSIIAVPMLLASFSFQTMVPSLTPYLKSHTKSLRLAIVGGTTIAFIVYLIWQWLVLGIIPIEGPSGLAAALVKGEPATQFLKGVVENPYVWLIAEYFAFFALITSFLGIGLGLFDFLSDGLKLKKQGWQKLVLAALIIVPTLFFAVYYERAFLVALETSGGFGDSILNGILPVLMVWIGRYFQGRNSHPLIPGGKPVLLIILLLFIAALIIEILALSGALISLQEIEALFTLPEKIVE